VMGYSISDRKRVFRILFAVAVVVELYGVGHSTGYRFVTHPGVHYGCLCWQSGRDLILDFGPARYRFDDIFSTNRPSGTRLDPGTADIASFDAGPDIRWGMIHLYWSSSGYASAERSVAPGLMCVTRQTEDTTDLKLAGHDIRLAGHGTTTAVDGVVFRVQSGQVVGIDRSGSVYLDYGPATPGTPLDL
jgi:hypothetical protein